MHNEKWIFYTDLFGRQRWERISERGYTIAESSKAFDTVAQAIADAGSHGYRPVSDRGAWALEWRIDSLDASSTAAELMIAEKPADREQRESERAGYDQGGSG